MLKYAGQYVFLWAKHFTNTEMHSELSTKYGSHSMSRPAIVKWCQIFEDCHTYLTDAEREGMPVTVSTPDMVQRGEDITRNNCKVREAHITCSENSKSIWVEGNFPTMTSSDICSKLASRPRKYSIVKASNDLWNVSTNVCSDWEIT